MNDFTRSSVPADGLYDPRNEHDACGVAAVARLDNEARHEVVEQGLRALRNLEHRGAAGADASTGDGAGILIRIPDHFLREEAGFELPAPGRYGVGMCFLPRLDLQYRHRIMRQIEAAAAEEGQIVLGWRDVPTDTTHVGRVSEQTRPHVAQVFIGAGPGHDSDQDAFERKLYVIRRVSEREAGNGLYIASLSSRTVVYKGMLTAHQLGGFYPELDDGRVRSALALVHSRFSTNTFPSWDLAHPFRMIAHNGEINTLRGNINWMRARESQLGSRLFGDDLPKVLPVATPEGSDSATFDNVLELLTLAGRSLPHAAMMMIPEAYRDRADLDSDLRGFYAYHSCLMEPWDGPAAVCFTDGRLIGATLDRNGLRPGRWLETTDGLVVLGSETGLLEIEPERVARRGRLKPGRLFLIDLDQGRIVGDAEAKREVSTARPYASWFAEKSVRFDDLPEVHVTMTGVEPTRRRQQAFGYTQEDLRVLISPMAATGAEPIGSMGNDSALAVLSDNRPPLYSYFKQLFAQVTNPPIDPIREAVVMSLATSIGAERNLLDESPDHARQLILDQPILMNHELETIRHMDPKVFRPETLDITWDAADGTAGLEQRLEELREEAGEAVAGGADILILSDRRTGPRRVPVPALLAVGAIHHHLVRTGTRLRTGLILESGEPREVHHMATLIGYGCSAINPYLLLDTVDELVTEGRVPDVTLPGEGQANVVRAIGKGLLKTISKMGISTIESYCGAQIFEAVGLDPQLVGRCFTGTPSRIGGIGIGVIAAETLDRHASAYPGTHEKLLPVGGLYYWRRDGEFHQWNPETISLVQHAVRGTGGDPRENYDEFSRQVNEIAVRRATLRGLFELKPATSGPIPLEDVEPAAAIVRRFATGAMSLGSLSREAHENLAIAMNRIGGRSNTGEGGEDPVRFTPDRNGDSRRSAIKQIASGRFGVTIDYLTNADQIQIKMAQGAKPGEGGQLPGHKVDDYIGSVRHTTPGVGLISPPPHHDIYSIEDLKQLIYDLRCANPEASVSVKLVAEVGVGTIAAGVAKANADHVLISGHDGGTGASPLSSVHSAGIPWEIGLAETQQTLLRNDLRSRITVQTDGQLKTGRDVVIAALLGADEFGFATAPLIASGCIMMRACHLNTCPVGIATQDPVLRRRFTGQPEHIVNYFFFVAEEARRIMAELGVASVDELIGRVELLKTASAVGHWKSRGVDVSGLLAWPTGLDPAVDRRRTHGPGPVLDDSLDWRIIEAAGEGLNGGEPVEIDLPIRNVDRCTGGILSHEIALRHGAGGLPDESLRVNLNGSAGQSFGGWLARGVSLSLTGEVNDYAGKGLSGGVIAVAPPAGGPAAPGSNVIVGNTALYGATSGRAFFAGEAGERFAVRNSGADAVVEGVGDHGCEYMTGGTVVVLGQTGRNFAAGMSGGIAYVFDPDRRLGNLVNPAMKNQLESPAGEDLDRIRKLVTEHRDRTGSAVAVRILDDWPGNAGRFTKVFPTDYKRVLAELEAERRRQFDEPQTIASAMEEG